MRTGRGVVILLSCLLLTTSILPYSRGYYTTRNCPMYTATVDDDNKNVMEINCLENITIMRDGHLKLDTLIRVSSDELVYLYEKALGASDSLEKFLAGFSQEQESLYGFHVTEIKEMGISRSNSSIYIHVIACAVPRYIDIKEVDNKTLEVKIENHEIDLFKGLMEHQSIAIEILLQSINGYQIFIKKSLIRFLSEDGISIDHISVGEGSYVVNGHALRIEYNEDSNSISITLLVDETRKRIKGSDIEGLFSVSFRTNKTAFREEKLFSDDTYPEEKSYDLPWDWSMDFFPIDIENEENGIYYSISMELYLSINGTLHYDAKTPYHYETWVDAHVVAELNTYVCISGEFEKSWSIPIYPPAKNMSKEIYNWCGCLSEYVVVVMSVEAELKVSVEGEIYVGLNPEISFDYTCGGYLDINLGYTPIRYTPKFSCRKGHSSLDIEYDGSFNANVVPGLKIRFAILFFGVAGPEGTLYPYIDGNVGFDTDHGWWWRADLCLDLLAGVNFLAAIHWEWPTPICHFIIKTWKGGNPPEDTTPPSTTISVGPMNRRYVGKRLYMWFNSTDAGSEASGVKTIRYRIPESENNEWKELNYPLEEPIEEISPGEDFSIEFYSIDKAGNTESKKTVYLEADLKDPVLKLDFEGDYVDCGQGVYQIKSDTKVKFLGRDSGSRKTNFRVWLFVEHGDNLTINCTKWFSCVDENWKGFVQKFKDNGNYKVKWVVEDKVGNCDYREISLIVKEELDEPSVVITFPKMGHLIIFDKFLIYLPLYSGRLFIACRYVYCEAKIVNGNNIEKVELECDKKRTWMERYPSEDDIYIGTLKGVSKGKHYMIVRGYNRDGVVVAEDKVKISVIFPLN